jgi:hypothetical protein
LSAKKGWKLLAEVVVVDTGMGSFAPLRMTGGVGTWRSFISDSPA